MPPGNDIYNNTTYDLKNLGQPPIIATGNYFGEPTLTELTNDVFNLSKIFDSKDDASVGQIVINSPYVTIPFSVEITTVTVAGGNIGSPYTQTFAGKGGKTPYVWSTTSSIPGLTLSPAGVLSGTPTQKGSFNFSVKLTDSSTPTPRTRQQTFTVPISSVPAITSPPTASGTVGVPFNYTITASGATSYNAANLPGGLSVSTATGVISGTPTTAGTPATFNTTISATNTDGTASAQLAFTIAKGIPIVTWSNPASITYPTPLSSTQLNATASVNGSFDYDHEIGTILSAGNNQTLSVQFTPNDTANYDSPPAKTAQISVLNPVPVLTSLSPTSAGSGGTGFTLTLNGSNFAANAMVQWSGQPNLSFETQSTTQLTTLVPASYIAGIGSATVTVFNPSPGGGTSTAKTFSILTASTTSAADAATSYSGAAQNVQLTATVVSTGGTVNEGTVKFEIKNGAANVGGAVTSPVVSNGSASATYTLPTGLAAGTYSINASYSGGPNFAPSLDTSRTLTVAPIATTTAAAAAAAAYKTAAQNVTLNATVTSLNGTVNAGTVTFKIKNGGATIGSPITSSTLTNGTASVFYPVPAGFAVGTYTLDVSYNGATSFIVSADSTHLLTISKASVSVAIGTIVPTAAVVGQSVNVPFMVTSLSGTPAGDVVVGDGVTNTTVSAASGSASLIFPTVGNRTLTVSYAGDANFSAGLATTSYTVQGNAPVITSALSGNGVVGQPFSYEIGVTGAAPITFSAQPLPLGLTLNGSSIGGIPESAGITNVTLTATNGSGSDSQTLIITINESGAPLITSALQTNGFVGTAFNYTITASGDSPFTFGASGLPGGLSLNGAAISGTPAAAGSFNVVLTASNALGTDSKTLLLSISAAGSPVITSTLSQSAKVGQLFTYSIIASGPGPITFGAANLPDWLSFSGNTLSGTPNNNDIGVSKVTLTASNANGVTVQELRVTVDSNVSDPPVITDIAVSRNPVRTNTNVAFTAVAVSPTGQPLTFSWFFFFNGFQDGPPLAGLTVARSFLSEGTYTVVAVAFDGFSKSANFQKIAVTLDPNPDGAGKNISGNTDDPSAAAGRQIHFGDSLAGVVDVDFASVNRDAGGDLFGSVFGRADQTQNNFTAFKFTQAQIVVVQGRELVPPSTPGNVVAQRMLAISEQEVTNTSSVKPPTSTNLTDLALSAKFNFSKKKRIDTLTLSFQGILPEGLDLRNGTVVYIGIGGAIVKFSMNSKGKGTKSPDAVGTPVNIGTKSTCSILRKGKAGVTGANATAQVKVSITSEDLISNGFGFLGIQNLAVPNQTVPMECLMLIEGVAYRQEFTATYKNSKGIGTLSKKK